MNCLSCLRHGPLATSRFRVISSRSFVSEFSHCLKMGIVMESMICGKRNLRSLMRRSFPRLVDNVPGLIKIVIY